MNREGIYRRRKKYQDFEPFTHEMYESINRVWRSVLDKVTEYKKKHNITQNKDISYLID